MTSMILCFEEIMTIGQLAASQPASHAHQCCYCVDKMTLGPPTKLTSSYFHDFELKIMKCDHVPHQLYQYHYYY